MAELAGALSPLVGHAGRRGCCQTRLACARLALDGGAAFDVDGAPHRIHPVLLRGGKTWKRGPRQLLIATYLRDHTELPVFRVQLIERDTFLDDVCRQGLQPRLKKCEDLITLDVARSALLQIQHTQDGFVLGLAHRDVDHASFTQLLAFLAIDLHRDPLLAHETGEEVWFRLWPTAWPGNDLSIEDT